MKTQRHSFLNIVLISLTFGMATQTAHANEKYEHADYWLSRGYQPHLGIENSTFSELPSWKPHSLAWPVEFENVAHSMGNSMAEFQSYGDGPYYHGGCDLRVRRGASLHTPITGRIEAGHYGYTNRPDGSSEKFWRPWPETGDENYFEVAVITDDGFRFEFHHMNEQKLGPEVIHALKAGSGRVEVGTFLGDTVEWPDGIYHHTHYNILSPVGTHLNPEYYSPLIQDHRAPEIATVLAAFPGNRTRAFGSGVFETAPQFFAIALIDHNDTNIYDHPTVYASVEFENGLNFVWDFRERLLGPDGKFPSIWSFFVESILDPMGKRWSTAGGYGRGQSVIRVPVPLGAHGAFVIKVADQANNGVEFTGRVGSSSTQTRPVIRLNTTARASLEAEAHQ